MTHQTPGDTLERAEDGTSNLLQPAAAQRLAHLFRHASAEPATHPLLPLLRAYRMRPPPAGDSDG
jgi:hypothetical protein